MDVVERELRSVFAALICSSVLSTRALTDDVNDDRENVVVASTIFGTKNPHN